MPLPMQRRLRFLRFVDEQRKGPLHSRPFLTDSSPAPNNTRGQNENTAWKKTRLEADPWEKICPASPRDLPKRPPGVYPVTLPALSRIGVGSTVPVGVP